MTAEDIFHALRAGEISPEVAEHELRALMAGAGQQPRQAPATSEASGEEVVHWRLVQPGVALVTMEDREHKNTFSESLLSGLGRVFGEVQADERCRVVVLTGYDGYFASGGTKEGLLAIQEGRVQFTDIDVYTLALDCTLPVVAAMQGHAIGAGWAMGMFCDFAVLGSESYYTSNYMKYGFTPGAGATLVFPERFGAALAREILFTGRKFRGTELQARGVPFPVVPRNEVLRTALDLAGELAGAPRDALIGLKSLMAAPLRERVADTLKRELRMHELTFVDQPEVRSRIAALFDGVGAPRTQPAAPATLPHPKQTVAPATSAALPSARPSGPGSPPAIAIVGMSGRFPMAEDLDTFWTNLAAGRDCVSEIPETRWSQAAYVDPDPKTPGKTHSKWMGVLEKADSFDPLFFNISPAEAEQMDPQQRTFLAAGWHCIEDAGILPSSLSGSRCGVFVGCGPSDYGQFLMNHGENPQGFTGASCSILSSRIAYFLNLKGPCLAIDTSCSSSGVALAEACDSLVLGTSDLALAGGVCVLSGPSTHVMASKAGMLSKDGRCFTFDSRANGFVPGEGVGVLLLKRLDDAVRDGDPVRGVIRGWGVNQDGRTNGITAPSGSSQTRLEKDVYDRFGIDPESITMVEAHGTGTKLGDPIEVEALSDAFRAYTDKEGFCSLGSVKSNIGHLLTAAGVAGVIKVLLAMEHQMRPPTIHLSTVNEHIRMENSPFYMNTSLEPWEPHGGGPRRAAVSSFGFSGTNAHLVIEEYSPWADGIEPRNRAGRDAPVLLVLSAQTDEQLQRYAAAVARTVENRPSLDLADLAYTLQVGREAMERRLALVARTREELLDALTGYLEGTTAQLRTAGPGNQELVRAAERWLAGEQPEWNRLYNDALPRRIHLPVYPFADERYWLPAFRESLRTAEAPDVGPDHAPQVEPRGSAPAASTDPSAQRMPVAERLSGVARATDRQFQVVELLIGELSELLRIPRQRLAARTAFADIGVDSLVVHRLLERLEEFCGTIPAEAFFKYKNIGDLARYISDHQEVVVVPQSSVEERLAPVAAPTSRDVAIIGVSGRFPKAETLEEYWVNLEFARDCVVEIPKERWDPRDYDRSVGESHGKSGDMYCKWGGFLQDVDRFDAAFFRISPREAKFMDPQERLFLQTAAACFEDAGYSRERLSDSRAGDGRASVGVFVGATYNNYQLHQIQGFAADAGTPVNSQTYSIANRVSYVFNLRGPSLCVDTACSSSLVALHLACESVSRGESAMAIAGGVNLSLHPSKYVSLCAAQFASSDGHCRAFGKDGDGYVPGEGVGAVLLKPLARAEADGDHIYAVIKGTAVNNDGRTFGYSVPNPTAQAEVIREALDRAGVDARTISYVEAHGTGTKLGDPVEISGLTEAYRKDTADRQFCAIGSTKSNIGHLEAAAGIAQLTKVLLQMKHRKLAASLIHAEELNPGIDFGGSPFYVQRVTADWKRPVVDIEGRETVVPRRAGISSFGAGGVNVHAIVEEYDADRHRAGSEDALKSGPAVIVLSAKRADRLKDYAEALRTHVLRTPDRAASLTDIAYTLQTGRDPHPFRLAFVATDLDDVARKLELFLKDHTADGEPVVHTGQADAGAGDTGQDEPPALPESLDSPPAMERAARLWAQGAEIDWDTYHRGPKPGRVPLPTYPFVGDRYWSAGATAAPAVPAEPTVPVAPAATATPAEVTELLAQVAAAPAETAQAPASPRLPEQPTPSADHETSELLSELVEALVVEREEILSQFMQERLAELLDYPPAELPETRQGFFDMGMESVMVERFRTLLEKQLTLKIPDTAIFDHPSVAALTEYLLGLVPWADHEADAAHRANRAPAGPPRTPAADMPPEEPGLEQVAGELRELLVQLGDIR
ncbi:beta-ketoacyl synthase N-terminal-like domain-containing protein [Streptomyces hyaluromycini]|uniref:beta-ketoacyl synthase N-terminal-like domain-containing protein n=1 Tax=Streptomyces hyaluromycini TaxID=1377993 RepID=UPI000B5CE8D9|nr:beta-ketoacyl synthase N-terminal-like domain-containing protein [Streptomyces hyaluromycini]